MPVFFISIISLSPAALGNSEPQAYEFLPSTSPDRQGQGNWRPYTIIYIYIKLTLCSRLPYEKL